MHDDRRRVEVVAVAQARLGGRRRDDRPVDDLRRALEHALALARPEAQVDRDGDRPQPMDGVQRDAEALAGRQRHAHAVARADAAAGQAARGRVDLTEQFGIGHRVHGRAVGMTLGRSRQPGIHEHAGDGSGSAAADPLPNYQAS